MPPLPSASSMAKTWIPSLFVGVKPDLACPPPPPQKKKNSLQVIIDRSIEQRAEITIIILITIKSVILMIFWVVDNILNSG